MENVAEIQNFSPDCNLTISEINNLKRGIEAESPDKMLRRNSTLMAGLK